MCDKNETAKNPITDTMDIQMICNKCLLLTHFGCCECRKYRSKFEKVEKERLIKENMYDGEGCMMCIDCFSTVTKFKKIALENAKHSCPNGMPISVCDGNKCNECKPIEDDEMSSEEYESFYKECMLGLKPTDLAWKLSMKDVKDIHEYD